MRRFFLLGSFVLFSCQAEIRGPITDAMEYDGVLLDEHRIFTSSVQYNGNFGGISGADTTCNALAASVGLKRQYRALLGTTTQTIASRFTSSARVMIYSAASGGFELVSQSLASAVSGSSSLLRNVALDESGAATTSSIWTCFTTTNCCVNWTDQTAGNTARTGSAVSTGPSWLSNTDLACSFTSRITCVSAVWNGSAWVF